jgi:hypothetical protein
MRNLMIAFLFVTSSANANFTSEVPRHVYAKVDGAKISSGYRLTVRVNGAEVGRIHYGGEPLRIDIPSEGAFVTVGRKVLWWRHYFLRPNLRQHFITWAQGGQTIICPSRVENTGHGSVDVIGWCKLR